MFVGRERELSKIIRRIKQPGFKAILVYGRRRIGKTQLVKEALSQVDIPSLSLLARDVDSKINLADFSLEAGNFMKISSFRPKDFYEFFSNLIEYSNSNPFVLFVDEYSFLKESAHSIDSSLQKAIEMHKDGANITIIICGSYVDVMARLVDYDAPLYGRFNEIIALRPFDYLDSGKFFPSCSLEDKFSYYAVFGGVAFNLTCLDQSLSFEENLIESFVAPNSLFEGEAVLIAKKELEKADKLNTIFELITQGMNTYKKISDFLGSDDKASFLWYIKRLEAMDLIDKAYSLTDANKRKPIYRLKDKMLEFYYTFLFKHLSQRELMTPEQFFVTYIKPKLYLDYLPRRFEELVKEYAIRENGIKIPLFTDAGNIVYHGYIHGQKISREFDLVLKTDEGLIPIECKYRKSPLSMADVHEEMQQWDNLPFKVRQYGFASRSGFDEEVRSRSDLLLIDMDDLYAIR